METTKGQVLVVDPSDIMRKLICGILVKSGYTVHDAAQADKGVELLSKRPDLVILDIDDETSDEVAFLRKMKRDYASTPTIALADDHVREEVQKKIENMPKLSFFAKPVRPDALVAQVEALLSETEQARAAAEAKKSGAQIDIEQQRMGFMRRAIDLSQQKMEENCGGPFGAVIVRQGKIIGEGWNCVTSTNDPTAHAEMVAIRNATAAIKDFKLEGCDIYTSCEPCPMCLAAIYWARLDKIYYANMREDAEKIGFDDAFLYREVALPENKRSLPVFRLLREEANIVFDNWMAKMDKTAY